MVGHSNKQWPACTMNSALVNGDVLMVGRGYVFFISTDQFVPPTRPIEKPFRCCIADIFKGFHFVCVCMCVCV